MRLDRDYFYQFHWRLGKDLKEVGKTVEAVKYFWGALCIKPHRLEALGLLLLCFVFRGPGKFKGFNR